MKKALEAKAIKFLDGVNLKTLMLVSDEQIVFKKTLATKTAWAGLLLESFLCAR